MIMKILLTSAGFETKAICDTASDKKEGAVIL